MSKQLIILLFAILSLISAVWSEIVSHRKCEGDAGKCTVNEVRINPCSEAAEGKPCRLKRGRTVELVADYTPQFSSNTLYARGYWVNGLVDIPFLDMDTDGCKSTPCPLAEGTRQTYTFDLKLSRSYPAGVYNVKWKLSGDNDDDDCCFMVKIQLK